MKIAAIRRPSMSDALRDVRDETLGDITPELVHRVLIRIIPSSTAPPTIEVAAFNSSI